MSDSNPFTAKRRLLQSPETMATVAHAILRSRWGDEWYWFDPLTISMDIRDDFKCEPAPEVMDRIAAIQTVMTGDAFFKRIDAFMAVCNAFSSGDPFFGAFDPVTAEEAAWGISEVGMNRDMLEFSPTIRQYCRTILRQNGYGDSDFPPVFDVVFQDGKPDLGDIGEGLVSDENGAALRKYIEEQASDLASQFDSIPGMENVDRDLLRKGLTKALGSVPVVSATPEGDFMP